MNIVELGQSSSRKTSLYNWFLNKENNHCGRNLIGFRSNAKEVLIQDNKIKVSIFDLQIVTKPDFITRKMKKFDGCILLYSILDKETFNQMESWIFKMIEHDENCLLILVWNKCDLESERQVTEEEGEFLANQYNIKHYEISVKDNSYLLNTLDTFIEDLFDKCYDKLDAHYYESYYDYDSGSNDKTSLFFSTWFWWTNWTIKTQKQYKQTEIREEKRKELKYLIVGETGIGKSAIVHSYLGDCFLKLKTKKESIIFRQKIIKACNQIIDLKLAEIPEVFLVENH